MSLIIKDRVKETTTTTGTGAVSLAGAMTGFRAFSSVMSNNDTCYYCIQGVDASGNPSGEWETGLGTYNSGGNTFTRTTVQDSSNSSAAVSLSAGTKHIFIDITASHVATLASGFVPLQVLSASGASVTIGASLIDGTYDSFQIVGTGIKTSNDGVLIGLDLKIGGSYSSSGYSYASESSVAGSGSSQVNGSDAGGTYVYMTNNSGAGVGNASGENISFIVDIDKPADTGIQKTLGFASRYIDANGKLVTVEGSGAYTGSNAALTEVKLVPSGGTFSSGSIVLYGRKKTI